MDGWLVIDGRVERWPMAKKTRRPILPFPSQSKMNELWKKHDYNGNGLLSQSEAKEVLKELWVRLKSILRSI